MLSSQAINLFLSRNPGLFSCFCYSPVCIQQAAVFLTCHLRFFRLFRHQISQKSNKYVGRDIACQTRNSFHFSSPSRVRATRSADSFPGAETFKIQSELHQQTKWTNCAPWLDFARFDSRRLTANPLRCFRTRSLCPTRATSPWMRILFRRPCRIPFSKRPTGPWLSPNPRLQRSSRRRQPIPRRPERNRRRRPFSTPPSCRRLPRRRRQRRRRHPPLRVSAGQRSSAPPVSAPRPQTAPSSSHPALAFTQIDSD